MWKTLESSYFVANKKLGDEHLTISDLKEKYGEKMYGWKNTGKKVLKNSMKKNTGK
jgi:hypothetical protein